MPHLYIIQAETNGTCESPLYVNEHADIFKYAIIPSSELPDRNIQQQVQSPMTTPPKKYPRTMYPCPGCNKPRLENHGMCRECRKKQVGRHVVRGNKCGTYIDGRGYERPLYSCLKCGKVKKHEGGMCRECSAKHRKENRKPNPNCKVCGKQTQSRFKDICETCRVREWRRMQRRLTNDCCIDCGVKKDHKSNIPRCRRCHGMHLRDVYIKTHGDLPLDREVVDASSVIYKVRRCPDCGGKITTKNCVRCTVLGKIGSKGFE